MKQYLLKVWMTAALSLLALGGVWGQTVTYSPSIGATDVSVSPVLSIEFDGEVTIGSGNIYVYNEDGKAFDLTIPARTGKFNNLNSVLSIDELNHVLKIDLSNQILPPNTEIYVEIESTVILVDGTEWSDLDNSLDDLYFLSPWSFTTETASPFWKEGYPSITKQTIDGFEFNAW